MALLKEKFDCDNLQETSVNVNAIYESNKEKYYNRIAELQLPRVAAEQFLEKRKEHDSLLYFETEIEKVVAMFRKEMPATGSTSPEDNSRNKQSLSIVGTQILYTDLKDLRQQLDANEQIGVVSADKIKIRRGGAGSSRKAGTKELFRQRGAPSQTADYRSGLCWRMACLQIFERDIEE